MLREGKFKLAAPCGLYCGVCSNYVDGTCHGCGCTANDCFAGKKHVICSIYKCTLKKSIQDCSLCGDFPCTELIQFVYDPIMKTHLPAINNLERRRKIGVETWLKEQEDYWKNNANKFKEWIEFHKECKAKKLRTN
jgi:hypothetical protein